MFFTYLFMSEFSVSADPVSCDFETLCGYKTVNISKSCQSSALSWRKIQPARDGGRVYQDHTLQSRYGKWKKMVE